jgi:hypothetical protein
MVSFGKVFVHKNARISVDGKGGRADFLICELVVAIMPCLPQPTPEQIVFLRPRRCVPLCYRSRTLPRQVIAYKRDTRWQGHLRRF